jgi:glucose-6-phosphate dehydrogenase assembly protein OpcA
MGSSVDSVWHAQDTAPSAIEGAMRTLLHDTHAANSSYVPERVLNMICVVDKEYSGEIANRLRTVGRNHPSRTVVCTVEQGRTTLDAVATIAAPADPKPGSFASTRESIIIACGPQHLPHLDRIVDPLVVSDITTMVWSPHGHDEALQCLLRLSQTVLFDGVDEPAPADALNRAAQLSQEAHVVDLAWLRSTPWRERIAATFDPAPLRRQLAMMSSMTVRHHPESAVVGLLLLGWLASRLGWDCSALMTRDGALTGKASGRKQDVALRLEPQREQQVRGLAGIELETAGGRWMRLDRGPGGLAAQYVSAKDVKREWTVLGASRGEAGILGEGIRQSLLRDPTYAPALAKAQALAS